MLRKLFAVATNAVILLMIMSGAVSADGSDSLPRVTNGDFQTLSSGAFTNWVNNTGLPAEQLVYFDETTGNYALKLTTGHVTQEVINQPFKANTKYRLVFRVNNDVDNAAKIKLEGSTTLVGGYIEKNFPKTNGAWLKFNLEFTTTSTPGVIYILLRVNTYVNYTGTGIFYDDVRIEEVDTEELVSDGSFEYGVNGMNSFTKEANSSAPVAEILADPTNKVAGEQSIAMTTSATYNLSALQQVILAPSSNYEVSAYIKPGPSPSDASLPTRACIRFETLKMNDAGTGYTYYSAGNTEKAFNSLALGEWTKVSFVLSTDAVTVASYVKLRVIMGGTLNWDKFSIKKLKSSSVDFSKENGAYTDKITAGKMKIKGRFVSPALEGASNIMFFGALYNAEGPSALMAISDIKTGIVSAGGYADMEVTISIPGDPLANSYVLKAFMWSDDMQPYEKVITLH